VIKDLNEKEQNEIIGAEGVGKFERGSKSYLSISKSGRLKSKKSTSSRALQDDLFNPVSSKLAEIASRDSNHSSALNSGITFRSGNALINKARPNTYDHHHHNSSSPVHKPLYDQNSDNADSSRTSSTSSSFR